MKHMKTYKNWYRFLANSILVLTALLCYIFVWFKYLNVMLDKSYLMKGNFMVLGIYAVIITYFISFFGGFKIGVNKKSNVIISQIIGLLISNGIYMIVTVMMAGYMSYIPKFIFYYGCTFMVQAILVSVISYLLMSLFYKVFPPYRILNIKGNHDNTLAEKFDARSDKYSIVGQMNYDVDIEAINAAVDDYDAVLINDVPSETRNKILKICFAKGKRVYITPKISDIIMRSTDMLAVFDTPLVLANNSSLSITERVIKRCFDVFLSAFGLILLSPLMILVSLAIFLYDRGPVFYRQTRYTKGGKTFRMLKFRSMIPNAEKDGVARLAADKDDRITPVGKFIRACRLDELPQFFNILAGDMSFVGPRPERPEIADEYEKELPEFAFRLKVKAGLTGYAQIFGKYNTTSYDKLKLDMIYVENCSLLMDLKLLLLTLKIVFIKESTEGLEEGQITATNKR